MHPALIQFNKFLSKNFFIPEAIIKPWKHFNKDLGLNSIEFLELIVYVEDYYGIHIPDYDLEKIQTVKDLYDYLESNLMPIPVVK